MDLSAFTVDLAYFGVAVFGDVLRVLAAGLVASSFLMALGFTTIFIIRNE